jgi:uncharacterized damage-inducible protein DinB
MRKIMLAALLGSLLALSAAAQTGQQAPQTPQAPQAAQPPQTPQAPQAPPTLATWLRNIYTTNRNYLAKAAEKVPEELYTMRPGPQVEVRTYGQLIGHLANANYSYCSGAKGEKNPNQGNDFEKVTAKADLVKALNDALTYCDATYAALTDSSVMEMVTLTAPNGRQIQFVRGTRLIQNFAHNNEHYGNLVTYMRIKSIVPPSSEPRPQ